MPQTEGQRNLRRAARQLTEAQARRDDAVVAMRAEGASLRDIAAAAGLTHPGVLKILRARQLAAAAEGQAS